MDNPEVQTIQATFRGVPFNLVVETREGGRKVAVSEYPGSDERFVEDLGKKPGTYRVQAFVSNRSGSDWLQQADRLTTALENKTEGILELTLTGPVKVKAVTYSSSIRQKGLGQVDFNISFMSTTDSPSPRKALSSKYTVATSLGGALDAAEAWMADDLIVPVSSTEALVSGYDGNQHMGAISSTVQRLGQKTDTVTALVNSVRNNISELTRDPIAYAAKVFNDGVLGEVFKSVLTSRDALNSMGKLCRTGFGLAIDFKTIRDDIEAGFKQGFDLPESIEELNFGIPKWDDSTQYRRTNNANRFIVTTAIRLGVFAIYLHQAADNDYPTDSDIDAVISDIDEVYQNVVLIEGVPPSLALAVDQCRIEAINVLEDKLVTTPNVEDYDLKTPTVDLEITYRLYAEELDTSESLTVKAQALTDLNNILPTRFEGEVKVLKV